MDSWINLITNAGFPISVASYLLIRFENKIDALSYKGAFRNTSKIIYKSVFH